jgi:hypothetical protein
MLESITISGNLLVAFTVWIGLRVLFNMCRVLVPNLQAKKILRTGKLPNDNVTRFSGMLFFSIFIYVLLYITEIIK